MSTLLWILLVLGVIFLATLELWADAVNWGLRQIGFQGVGQPQPRDSRRIATVERAFVIGADSPTPVGKVFYEGALWNATCDPALLASLKPGDRVEIEHGQSVMLTVKRKIGRPV
jgi:membrane protein implicated in regulation of membrane protease activity